MIVDGHIGQLGFRHFYDDRMGVVALGKDLHPDRHRGIPDTDDFSKKTDDIAHRDRLLEQEGIDRDRGHTAARTAHGGNRARHIDLGHHPAAEHIAVLIQVGRHGHHTQGRLAIGQGQTVNGHDGLKMKSGQTFSRKACAFHILA